MDHGDEKRQLNRNNSSNRDCKREDDCERPTLPKAEWESTDTDESSHVESSKIMKLHHSTTPRGNFSGSVSTPSPLYQANSVGYLTQSPAFLNNLAVHGNHLIPNNCLPPIGWSPGSLPPLQAAGMLQYPTFQTQIGTHQSIPETQMFHSTNVINHHGRSHNSQRQRENNNHNQSWDEGTSTESDSSDSSSTNQNNSRYSCDKNVDVTDFCVAVATQAAKYVPNGEGHVSTKVIDWEKVASEFPALNAKICRRLWKRHFKKHRLVRLPQGSVFVCDTSGNNRQEMTKASSYQYQSHVNPFVQDQQDFIMNLQENQVEGRRKVKRVKLTKAEEEMVGSMQQKYGNKWTFIAEKMETGRTGVEIKNYWHNLQHKIALRLLKEQKQQKRSNESDCS